MVLSVKPCRGRAAAPTEGDALTKKKLTIEETAALEALQGVDVPDQIRNNMALFLRLVRKVLEEADQDLRAIFDVLLFDAILMNDDANENPEEHEAFEDMASIITCLLYTSPSPRDCS